MSKRKLKRENKHLRTVMASEYMRLHAAKSGTPTDSILAATQRVLYAALNPREQTQ